MRYNLITILGPTAVGKTKLSAQLSNKFNGEIISADSRQVYKGMDIGTGKDIDDYTIDGSQVPLHLIDVISPLDEFDLYKFTKLFHSSFEAISLKEKTPFLVGGTGLYLHSILTNYNLANVDFNCARAEELKVMKEEDLKKIIMAINPNHHNTTDLTNKERMIKAILVVESATENKNNLTQINSLNIGVSLDREEIKLRITKRLKERLENGMIEEVERLISEGITHDKLHFFGLEYKYVSLYLQNQLNYNDMYQKLNSAIHNFAKRQMTWFRKMEREGTRIKWIEGPDFNEASKIIEKDFIRGNA
jgi:tRNA dimethylallyltransferase